MVPGSRLVIAVALTAPWAVPAGIVASASIVPIFAHPVAASADTVVHWESTMSIPLPCGKVVTSTSPVVRHGISVWPLFQRRPSRLSSNAIAAVPLASSRVKARYRNVSVPGWSTAPHASRMLTLPGETPPGSVVFVPVDRPENLRSPDEGRVLRVVVVGVHDAPGGLQPLPVDVERRVVLVAVAALEVAPVQRQSSTRAADPRRREPPRGADRPPP